MLFPFGCRSTRIQSTADHADGINDKHVFGFVLLFKRSNVFFQFSSGIKYLFRGESGWHGISHWVCFHLDLEEHSSEMEILLIYYTEDRIHYTKRRKQNVRGRSSLDHFRSSMMLLKYSGYPKHVRRIVFYMNLSSAAPLCTVWFDRFLCRHPHSSCLTLLVINPYLRLQNWFQLRLYLKITSAIFVSGVKGVVFQEV